MKLNGIAITGKLFESVINDFAEHTVERICEEYTEQALNRVMDPDALVLKLQADAEFRSVVERTVTSTIQDMLNENLFDYDVEYEVTDTMLSDETHWLAEHRARLEEAQEQLDQEDMIQAEAEQENYLAEQIRFLQSQGYAVQTADPKLQQALQAVSAAGYKVKKETADG